MSRKHAKTLRVVGYIAALIAGVMLPILLLPRISARFASLTTLQLDVIRTALIAFPTIVLYLWNILYNEYDSVKMLAHRWYLSIFNREIIWSLTVNALTEVNENGFEAIFQGLVETASGATIMQNERLVKIVSVPLPINGTIRMRLFPQQNEITGVEETSKIVVELSQMAVAFRRSSDAIDALAVFLEKHIIPHAVSGKIDYTFKMDFDGRNPYFGLFVQRLSVPLDQLVNFNCMFEDAVTVPQVGKISAMVTVNKSRISLVADTLNDFKMMSKRYISLSAVDLNRN